MKKSISVLLTGMLCAQMLTGCASAAGGDASQASVSELEPGAVVITTDVSEYDNREIFVMYLDGSSELLSFEDENSLSAALESLSQDETVSLVQPNYSYSDNALSVSDEYAGQQWALSNDGSFEMEEERNEHPVYDEPFGEPQAPGQWQRPDRQQSPGFRGMSAYRIQTTPATAVEDVDIDAEEGWELYSTQYNNGATRDVIVAMVDTGIDYTHEDLTNSIWVNEDEIPDNGIDDDGNGYIDDVYGWNFYSKNNQVYVGDEDSHGTHGAGTIAAKSDNGVGISGIAQGDNIRVMAVKALGGEDGSGSTASIIQAIQYAENNGASICNLSLGTATNDMALYRTVANSDMLFVVAAGNDGANAESSPCYPASYDLDNIISVANLSYDGTLHYSSNYGNESVDIAAPGAYILSTTAGDSYSYMTGTSMSAPMVSGVAAMVYSYYAEISLANVKDIILSSAVEKDALAGSTACGGMVNLYAALSYGTDGLSDAGWDAPAELSGSAPVITLNATEVSGKTHLTVSVQDADNDLYLVCYASGTLTAGDFAGGAYGRQMKISEGEQVTYAVNGDGEITFYAIDSAGNETVESISITSGTSSHVPSDDDPSGGMPPRNEPSGHNPSDNMPSTDAGAPSSNTPGNIRWSGIRR